jgi:hypothetical protein
MDIRCRLCLYKTEQDESVNIFTFGKNNELISDTIMSFVPIEVILLLLSFPKFFITNVFSCPVTTTFHKQSVKFVYKNLTELLNFE